MLGGRQDTQDGQRGQDLLIDGDREGASRFHQALLGGDACVSIEQNEHHAREGEDGDQDPEEEQDKVRSYPHGLVIGIKKPLS